MELWDYYCHCKLPNTHQRYSDIAGLANPALNTFEPQTRVEKAPWLKNSKSSSTQAKQKATSLLTSPKVKVRLGSPCASRRRQGRNTSCKTWKKPRVWHPNTSKSNEWVKTSTCCLRGAKRQMSSSKTITKSCPMAITPCWAKRKTEIFTNTFRRTPASKG